MKNIENKKDKKHEVGPYAHIIIPIIGAVIVVATAIAYICLKITDELTDKEKWRDYDECGWH